MIMQTEFDEKGIMVVLIGTFAYLYCRDLCCYRGFSKKISCIVYFIENVPYITVLKNGVCSEMMFFNHKIELQGTVRNEFLSCFM